MELGSILTVVGPAAFAVLLTVALFLKFIKSESAKQRDENIFMRKQTTEMVKCIGDLTVSIKEMTSSFAVHAETLATNVHELRTIVADSNTKINTHMIVDRDDHMRIKEAVNELRYTLERKE